MIRKAKRFWKKSMIIGIIGMVSLGATWAEIPITVMGKSVTMEAQQIHPWNLDKMVHPDLKTVLAASPSVDFSNMETIHTIRMRQVPSSMTLPTDDKVEVHNIMIPGYNGAPDLRVRVYQPKTELNLYPAVLWIHGGGHILGVPEMDEGLSLKIAKETNSIVVAPDYRLAPENPYPADIDDVYAALSWMTNRNISHLPINLDRVAVAGDSAGGGLTTALAIRSRDNNGPKIHFMMPLYPMLDNNSDTVSMQQIKDHRVWNQDANIAAWQMYLGSKNNREVSPYASPAHVQSVLNLPPAYIMIGPLDPFRDETINFVQRLLQAGVPVEFHIIPGVTHAFELVYPDTNISREARDEYVQALNIALHN